MNQGATDLEINELERLIEELLQRHTQLKAQVDALQQENVKLKEQIKTVENGNTDRNGDIPPALKQRLADVIQQVDKCLNSL